MTDEATTGLDASLIEATAEDALVALDKAGTKALDLIELWVKRGNAAAVAETAESSQGGLRKAARRGLNVLKSRGFAVPDRSRVARVGGAPTETIEEAWLLPPDANGNTLLVFTRRATAGRCQAAFVVVNDSVGVQRVDNDNLSQSKLQERFDHALRDGAAGKPVQVPVAWARWRVASSLQQHARRGVPEPLGLTTARELLQPAPEQPPPHPLEEEGLVLDDEDARELAKTSATLHRFPEFQGWLPTKRAVDEIMLKVGQTMRPGETPPDGHVEAQLETEVKAATDRYFTPEARERLVAVMKDSTLGVLARAGEQSALEVVAAMKAIEQCGLITNPPHEVQFLRAFFDKAVALLVAQGNGSLRIPIPNRPSLDEPTSSPDSSPANPDDDDHPSRGGEESVDGAGADSGS